MRILVVQDTPELSEFIITTLQAHDLEPRYYETSAEAFSYFRTRSADLLIIDLGMVGKSPWQVIRAAHQASDKVAIIALTYYVDNQKRNTDLLESVDHYLVKPFTVEELMQSVHNLISSSTSS